MPKNSDHRLAEAVWVLGECHDTMLDWVGAQIERLVLGLCGSKPRFSTQLAGGLCVVVGTPETNRFVRDAFDGSSLGQDDFVLKRTVVGGVDVLMIAGRTVRGAMYGVFDLFEQLGCTFLISKDVVPDADPGLAVPVVDRVGRTACLWRGVFYGGYCFATNFMMSLPDYESMFDQMAKMKMNRIIFYHFENEPFIDYTYKGERKLVGDISDPDSGYISYGRQFTGSFRVGDLPVAREKFDRGKIAPLEFQNVSSSDEALDCAKGFMQQVIGLAKRRGIGVWISTLPMFVPPNLSKYTRRMPRTVPHWSAHVSCTDPVATEINRARIEGIVEAYPDIEGVFLGIPEGFFDDPYAESRQLIDRQWANYAEALALQKQYWGTFWPGEEQQKAHIRADIAFVEIVKKTVAAAKEVKPDLKLGICTVCKAYLLTHLDTILPKDMPFVDIESRSLWTLEGAPLHLFKRMAGRQCVIIPRAVDDGSLAGLQFPLWQYHKDGFLTSPAENGTNGLMVQTTHIRGNEHSLKFFADGMWDASLTPTRFYSDYTLRLFGESAGRIVAEAFAVLERNDEAMGGRGLKNMPWNMTPPHIWVMGGFKDFDQPFHQAPFDASFVNSCKTSAEKFTDAVACLEEALELFVKARSLTDHAGSAELAYLISRTRGYRCHLLALVKFTDVYDHWLNVFASLDDDLESFGRAFADLVAEAGEIETIATKSAGHFADCVEHATDLGVLWMISHKMVLGSRCLRGYLENILAFYEGREYWRKVDWDILFGQCPFPTYDFRGIGKPAPSPDEEPG